MIVKRIASRPPLWSPALPTAGGVYVLVLHCPTTQTITVGGLGPCAFAAGWYLYVGSALSNLPNRLNRHARLEKRYHWHIDYVRAGMILSKAWCHAGSEQLECPWARRLAQLPSLCPYGRPLGASDCACYTHLFYGAEETAIDEAYLALAERWDCSRHRLQSSTLATI